MIQAFRAAAGKHADVALVFLVLAVLAVLFAPIPAPLLDLLIIINVAFGLLLLLLTFYMPKPADFSTFPSLLLLATLFRLALNVAATRLILTEADAGKVISAVGSYVVGGNYVIGLIVFLILVVVQYVVVTSGAQRVSEVAARFTLDSMPGQQMSIDADLNMGLIDQDEAKRRRAELEKEAAFYGSMDGASKFVKGDAIAGIIILLINIIGGLTIGVMQMGMPWGDALRTYTLLTVGDGIVTQIPALIIAVGTGIIVTRSASDAQLTSAAVKQILSYPKTLVLVIAALAILLLLPGIPAWPVLLVMGLVGGLAWVAFTRPESDAKAEAQKAQDKSSEAKTTYTSLALAPIEVRLGPRLKQAFVAQQDRIMERIAVFREDYAQDLGLLMPKVAFQPHESMSPDDYEIRIYGVTCGRGQLHPDRTLAIHARGDVKLVRGIETREPTYGLPAVWIEDSEKDHARAQQYTLVEPIAVFVTHLTEVLKGQSTALLTRTEVDALLERVRSSHPGLLEELVPTVLSVGDVQKVLQGLLRERVSIRNIESIVEVLADVGRGTKDPGLLVEAVRQRLGAAICQSLLSGSNALQVITLEPQIEQTLLSSLKASGAESRLVVEPTFAEQLIGRLAQQCERMMKSDLLPVVLCSPELRRHIRGLCERVIPHARVLALTEIPQNVGLKSFAVVKL